MYTCTPPSPGVCQRTADELYVVVTACQRERFLMVADRAEQVSFSAVKAANARIFIADSDFCTQILHT